MIRAFSLTAIVCLTLVLFWYGRSGVARPGIPETDGAVKRAAKTCAEDGSCTQPTPLPTPSVGAGSGVSFPQLVRRAWEAIPLKRDLQNRSSQELHESPPELLAAAEALGQIEEALSADRNLLAQGLKFFRDCAVNDQFPTSVRALCYHRFRGWLPNTEMNSLTAAEVPDEVRTLADQLDVE